MVSQRDNSIHSGPIDLGHFRLEVELDPFYQLVPREIEANLEYRAKIIKWGSADSKNAETLWRMCKRSLLFYVGTFVWLSDARETTAYPCLPFVPYPFQEETLLALNEAIGKHDVLVDKSRGMGASWMGITVIEWRWHFRELESFLLVSRKAELVDKTGDPKALMWKIDFIHGHLPGWLVPTIKRSDMHIFSYDTGSTIDGEATTGEVARGDYRTGIFMDEFAAVQPIADGYRALASTQGATRSRIFNSTTQGPGNAYYDLKQKGIPRITLHWPLHPIYSEGISYRKDGKPTSPWYEGECLRAAHPSLIARELDMNDEGAEDSFFETKILNDHMSHTCEPYVVGELLFDPDTLEPTEFVKRDNGRLRLWVELTDSFSPTAAAFIENQELGWPVASSSPPCSDYVVGIDVSAGTGSSNSTAVVGDKKTGHQVAEFVDNQMPPETFADFSVALAKWFKTSTRRDDVPEEGAYIVWENNGPAGKIFSRRMMDSGYRHFYRKQREDTLSKKSTDAPGWVTTRTTKAMLLGELRIALRDNLFIVRSNRLINECRMYVYSGAGGDIIHAKSRFTGLDPSGAGESHGDIVIGGGLAWQGMKSTAHDAEPEPEPPVLWGSYLHRRARRRRLEHAEDEYGVKDEWCDELLGV